MTMKCKITTFIVVINLNTKSSHRNKFSLLLSFENEIFARQEEFIYFSSLNQSKLSTNTEFDLLIVSFTTAVFNLLNEENIVADEIDKDFKEKHSTNYS